MSVGILELKDGVLVNKTYATKGIKTVTDKGFFGFEIISGHLWLVYGAIKPDISFDENQHLIIDFDGNVDLEEVPPQTAGYPLGNVGNLSLKEGSDSLTLTWSDPENIVFNNEDKAVWAGTKVVRKEGIYPTSETDGTVIADSTVKDQYAESGLVDADVTEDVQYNYVLFPYTDKNVYTMSDVNKISGQTRAFDPVLANNDWSVINAISEAGLAQDVWNIGDKKDGYVIVGFNHDDLADGSGKAGITFALDDLTDITAIKSFNSVATYFRPYTSTAVYNAINNIYNGLPEDLKNVIKDVLKKTVTAYNTSNSGVTISDLQLKVFAFSRKELGNQGNQEGEYYREYDWAGEGKQQRYWTRSAYTVKVTSSGVVRYDNWSNAYNSSGKIYFSYANSASGSVSYPRYGFCI